MKQCRELPEDDGHQTTEEGKAQLSRGAHEIEEEHQEEDEDHQDS